MADAVHIQILDRAKEVEQEGKPDVMTKGIPGNSLGEVLKLPKGFRGLDNKEGRTILRVNIYSTRTVLVL